MNFSIQAAAAAATTLTPVTARHCLPAAGFCSTPNPRHWSHACALQILVELAELQDQEVGDGTTSVVIVAAELLKRANELVRAKIHPTSIIGGYRLAMREAVKYIEGELAIPTSSLGADTLMAAAITAMSSKIVGADPQFYGRIVVDAVTAVRNEDPETGRCVRGGGLGAVLCGTSGQQRRRALPCNGSGW